MRSRESSLKGYEEITKNTNNRNVQLNEMDKWQKENESEENFVGRAVQGVVECEKVQVEIGRAHV